MAPILVGSGEDDEFYASDDNIDGEDCDAFDPEVLNADDNDQGTHAALDSHGSRKNYTPLSREDIQRRLEDDVTEVSSVLSIPRESARLLLRHYHWSVNTAHDEWFADEERVRKAVGLLEELPIADQLSPAKKLTCGICFDEYPQQMISTAICEHPFCRECWKGYITTSIIDGPGCLLLRCPQPSCLVAVDKDMINELCDDDECRKRYYEFMIRSYVEDNREIKWCPAPHCDWAVEFAAGSGSSDVICGGCSYEFCWDCTEDAHRPVDCDTVAKWMLEKSAEHHSSKHWIIGFTKPCPKCQRPIQKSMGCNLMTCRPPCLHRFCWMCLRPHSPGHFCNRYVKEDSYDQRRTAQAYTHYYERWANNQSSREKAQRDLQNMKEAEIANLSEILDQPEAQLKFILDAWVEIVECRRVLKWTYAYGYYLSDQNEKAKTAFFEYLQGEAEAVLERLHECVEKELMVFFQSKRPPGEFDGYKVKLTQLTTVTKNYFKNLIRALENGLADVSETRGFMKINWKKLLTLNT